MLSVIIPTCNSEQRLVPTLSALVSGATAGIVSEVLLADSGSRDDTAAVADVAGCNFMVLEGPLGRQLKAASAQTRAAWLLFLRPGTVLDTPWTGEVGRFIQQPARQNQAAVFRRGYTDPSAPREFLLLLSAVLGGLPRPEQGLLISKAFYDTLGGHSERASNPDQELLRRIGRQRIVRLSTNAFAPN
jgi:glycosyltransferase involved in cell wall biosynthesis